ncbi:ferredoxin-type protein NapF [Wenxinia marina]|nr:ferredoxin-type protein NapF [Wenxinia marina]
MACTGCGECVDACPEQVLTIAEGRVALEMAAGECTFCGTCSDACPESVFTAGAGMAHEMILGDDCLARNGVSCMTCRDACPEEAITVRPRIGGPFLPVLDPALCSGCGACVGPCPAGAITPQIREPADA